MSWFKNVNKERESKNARDENWENLKFPIDLRIITTLIELLKKSNVWKWNSFNNIFNRWHKTVYYDERRNFLPNFDGQIINLNMNYFSRKVVKSISITLNFKRFPPNNKAAVPKFIYPLTPPISTPHWPLCLTRSPHQSKPIKPTAKSIQFNRFRKAQTIREQPGGQAGTTFYGKLKSR